MKRPPTIVVDIDGVIATGGPEVYGGEDGMTWSYELCRPIERGIALLRRLRLEGIRIVLYTARWERDRSVTVDWLKDHKVPYDELALGKPSGDVYIDDRNWPEPFDPERMAGFTDFLVDEVRRRAEDHNDLMNRDE